MVLQGQKQKPLHQITSTHAFTSNNLTIEHLPGPMAMPDRSGSYSKIKLGVINRREGRCDVRTIKMLGLAAVAALAAMAVVGASSASATFHTAICLKDPVALTCDSADEPATVHFEDKTAVLKTTTPALTITCEGLLEGENLKLSKLVLGVIQPLEVHVATGGLKYSNCDKGCTATNEAPGLLLLLKTGTDTATLSAHGFKVRLKCGVVVDCKYNAEGLVGHALGALKAPANGLVITEEKAVTKEGGGVCPATAKLTVEYAPLVPLYIKS